MRVVLGLVALFLVVGCDDNGSGTDAGDEDAGSSVEMDAGPGDDDAGVSEEDAGAPPDPLYAICGFTFTPEGPSGYLVVVPDLDASTSVDLASALEVPGGLSCAAPGNSNLVYVGRAESPVIERYAVADDGTLTLEDMVSFAGLGLTATTNGRNPMQLLSATRAYYIDGDTLQVIVWNPTDMVIDGSFDIDGLARTDLGIGSNFVMEDGDRLVMSARYFRPDGSAELLATAVIIDTTDDSVTYAEDMRCGNLAWSAKAANGDMYFASHPSQAARVRTGQAGTPVSQPCLLRILAGENDFDSTFYVELNPLTGDQPTGALLQGDGNTSYLLAYDETEVPITMMNMDQLTRLPAWRYYQVDLSGDVSSATEVAGVPAGAGYGLGFVLQDAANTVPFVISVAGDLSAGTFFDLSGGTFDEAITAPGFPGVAFRVR